MQVARDADPTAKEAELRAKEAERQRQRTVDAAKGRASAPSYTAENKQEKSKPALSVVTNEPQSEQAETPAVTAPAKPEPSPEDEALVAEFLDLFRKMSDETRVRALQGINALYRRWKEGEE